MGVVLAGLVETATFQAGICSTEGPQGRGAKTPSQVVWYQVGTTERVRGGRGKFQIPRSRDVASRRENGHLNEPSPGASQECP